jgi:hypothetical protein
MASSTPKTFAIETQLATSAVTIHTPSAASEIGVFSTLSFYNTNATDPREVTVYRVAASSTAGTTNILDRQSIAPKSRWICVPAINSTIEFGESIQAVQDAGADVNVNASGSRVLI